MRQGQQHRRGRGRNNNVNNNSNNNHPGNRKGQNPLTRSFESNGPDVKVRGTPAHIAEKYLQLARDAQSSGDHVLAENYLQHAEHYNRIIFAYREQQMQQQPGEMMNGNGRHQHQQSRQDFMDADDGGSEESGEDNGQMDQPPFARHVGEQSRDAQPSFDEPPRQHQPRNDHQPRFRDRHSRGDRSEQGDRFDRRERPFRSSDQPGENREIRPQREPREHRHPPEAHPEISPPSLPMENGAAEAVPAPRPETPAPRRRERFGLGADQPEFLRRPVRRPRREPEQEFAPETPEAVPSADEPSRE